MNKTFLGTLTFLVILAVFALTSCFSPWEGDEGAITISIGGGNSRNADGFTDEEISGFEHIISLSNGPGPDQSDTITGAGQVKFTVSPGYWDISVEARNDDHEIVAEGASHRAYVRSGQNSSVQILMHPITVPEPENPDPEYFEVSFNTNGGEPEPDSQNIQEGGKAKEVITPERKGYTFDGWYTDNGTFNNRWIFDEYSVNESIILHAKWNKNITFESLKANGSETSATTTLTLTFSEDIGDLTRVNITFIPGNTGANMDSVEKTVGVDGEYIINLSGVIRSGKVSVIVSKAGYVIEPDTMEVLVTGLTHGSAPIRVELWLIKDNVEIFLEDSENSADGIEIYQAYNEYFTVEIGNADSFDKEGGNPKIQWYLWGGQISGDKVNGKLTINAVDYAVGTYQLLVILYKNNVPYSAEITFTVYSEAP